MKVSIIIPVYNNEKLIGRCLESLRNQTYDNIEIIVVNDGSTDLTLDRLFELKDLDERISILDQANSGTHLARLHGIKRSTGEAILHVDSDDYLEIDAVEHFINFMIKEDADIVLANHLVHKGSNTSLVINQIPLKYDQLAILKYFLLGKIKGYIWGKLFRRHLLENIVIPADKRVITEDVLTNLYVLCNYKVKIVLIEKALIHYTEDKTVISFSKDRKNIEGFFDEVKLVEKILEDSGFKNKLEVEIATYKCRAWVIYCRAGGPYSKDKEFHMDFYRQNFQLAKRNLPFYQRIEMIAYSKSLGLGRLTTASMKWLGKFL